MQCWKTMALCAYFNTADFYFTIKTTYKLSLPQEKNYWSLAYLELHDAYLQLKFITMLTADSRSKKKTVKKEDGGRD